MNYKYLYKQSEFNKNQHKRKNICISNYTKMIDIETCYIKKYIIIPNSVKTLKLNSDNCSYCLIPNSIKFINADMNIDTNMYNIYKRGCNTNKQLFINLQSYVYKNDDKKHKMLATNTIYIHTLNGIESKNYFLAENLCNLLIYKKIAKNLQLKYIKTIKIYNKISNILIFRNVYNLTIFTHEKINLNYVKNVFKLNTYDCKTFAKKNIFINNFTFTCKQQISQFDYKLLQYIYNLKIMNYDVHDICDIKYASVVFHAYILSIFFNIVANDIEYFDDNNDNNNCVQKCITFKYVNKIKFNCNYNLQHILQISQHTHTCILYKYKYYCSNNNNNILLKYLHNLQLFGCYFYFDENDISHMKINNLYDLSSMNSEFDLNLWTKTIKNINTLNIQEKQLTCVDKQLKTVNTIKKCNNIDYSFC